MICKAKFSGRRKNAYTANFLAICILRLIRWIYLNQSRLDSLFGDRGAESVADK
jgi:hypothetical protein